MEHETIVSCVKKYTGVEQRMLIVDRSWSLRRSHSLVTSDWPSYRDISRGTNETPFCKNFGTFSSFPSRARPLSRASKARRGSRGELIVREKCFPVRHSQNMGTGLDTSPSIPFASSALRRKRHERDSLAMHRFSFSLVIAFTSYSGMAGTLITVPGRILLPAGTC